VKVIIRKKNQLLSQHDKENIEMEKTKEEGIIKFENEKKLKNELDQK
jgi:hypothetical protein